MILLETSLLELAYERRTEAEPPAVAVLRALIRENVSLGIPGIVWQELLAGVRSESQFRQLEAHLAAFPLLLASQQNHAEAARIAAACATRRIECSAVQALVAAHTMDAKAPLFTLDRDYAAIARVAGFEIFDYRAAEARLR